VTEAATKIIFHTIASYSSSCHHSPHNVSIPAENLSKAIFGVYSMKSFLTKLMNVSIFSPDKKNKKAPKIMLVINAQ
jgi:hypothetical protein